MMNLRTIRLMSDSAARHAAKEKKLPYVPFDAAEVDALAGFPFPFLGEYVPPGWELVDRMFCDSSGFGLESEPALTARAVKEKLKQWLQAEYGYGILEAGPFQVYVGVYKRVATAP